MVEVPDFKVGDDALASSKCIPKLNCALAAGIVALTRIGRRIKPGSALLTTVL